MSILEYILIAAFLILLFLYILNLVINNKFRKRTVEYLKNQKKQIQERDVKVEELSDKVRELNAEKVEFQNTVKKQGREYQKIGIILERGIEVQSNKLLDDLTRVFDLKSIPKTEKEKVREEMESYGNQVNNMISWYQSVYGDNPPEATSFEIIELTQGIINEVTSNLQYKNITFINHIGEPLNVLADQNMISYAINTIATLLGVRSVSGNTMYVDVERTGKKCLITFEDAGPGTDDDLIKDLAGESFEKEKMRELDDFSLISFLMAKDLVEKNGGKLWVSSIMEVGVKISFSLPIE